MNILEALETVAAKQDLNTAESKDVMDEIMEGKATPSQIAALLMGLRMKGEAVPEITGFAKSMRAHCLAIKPKRRDLVDTCGTGGDLSNTFNISTLAAFVAAGAGVSVAKHGNRSISSRCGSADLLEALGVKIDLTPEQCETCIEKVGFGFMFAPNFHPAMKTAAPVRRELGLRTVFNILGPLTNPAGASAQVLGVYDENLMKNMAQVLRNLGTKRAFLVHGMDGLDEISITGKTRVTEIKKDGRITTYLLCPEDLEIASSSLSAIIGGNAEQNARIALDILENREHSGPRHDIVLLNAAAAIAAGDKAETLREAVQLARQALQSGASAKVFFAFKELTQSFGKKPVAVKKQKPRK